MKTASFCSATVSVLALAWASGPTTTQAAAPASQAVWTIPSDASIHALLEERMHLNGVGAVVGVIEPDGHRIVTYGKSGAANGRPLDGDTVFQLGSLTKVFTGLLLADMVQRREVALDDAAQKYFPPGARMPQRGRPITLLDLITHRSGLPSMPTNFRIDADPNPVEAYTVEELWQFLSTFEPPREPGEKYEYSNLGVSLLGRLLALRAGMDYEALLKQRVLKPLGMDSSGVTVDRKMSARLAPGHDRYLQPVHTWEMTTLPASGSLRSSTNDMLRFLDANLGNRETVLKDAITLQLATRSPADPGQALAWGARKIGDIEIYSHEGGKQGYRSAVAFDLKAHTAIVVLVNARTDDRPAALALHLLTGRVLPPVPAPPAPRKVVKLSARVIAKYAGLYRLGDGSMLNVVAKRDHLIIDYDASGYGLEFLPNGEREFFYNVGNDEITFQLDNKGEATGLLLYPDGKDVGKTQFAQRLRER
jgi:D-alanyl-D-alanine-carboxypeptidase/D-alanyl-D-alanine-endopeptidase